MAEAVESCYAQCATCNMPIRVFFDAHGNIVRVIEFCGHVQHPATEGE